MVGKSISNWRAGTMALIALMAWSGANAGVTARIDRSNVELNESFVLEVVVDSNIDVEPDVSGLDADFTIGHQGQLSNTSIINGQISRSKTWTFTLMAKRAGALIIPPIRIGDEQSEPVTVLVSEPTYAPPGEADVFITSEVDYDETYVQAQILYTIKIYRAVPTRQPAIREPVFSGAEVLIEPAGEDRSYEAVLNERSYNVVEQVFALFPQASGEISISPARFEARVLRDGRITGRKVFDSEAHTITVKSIPTPPAEFAGATWLPARDLALTEEWSRDFDELSAGEPVTRKVTISALGQLETNIPVLDPPDVDGVNAYPDKPELTRQYEAGGIRGSRKDQYAIIGVSGGNVSMPDIEVPWYDVEADEWRVASLAGRTISIVADYEPPPVETATTDAVDVVDSGESRGLVPPGIWRRVSEVLAGLWVLTLFAWWWSSRPISRTNEPKPVPLHKQQARHLSAARKAALSGDGQGVRKAMLEWGRLQWPDDPPRSIGTVATRVTAPLAEDLQNLANDAYGPGETGWDGNALAKSLRKFAVIGGSSAEGVREILPPLMPGTQH